jgi:hypothetical protein
MMKAIISYMNQVSHEMVRWVNAHPDLVEARLIVEQIEAEVVDLDLEPAAFQRAVHWKEERARTARVFVDILEREILPNSFQSRRAAGRIAA